ncbi:MAG: 4Fe-4S binding protein [Fibrobacteria bacterium]|nr:4Fe-4S binding protein [Fibrobacteria bacterium]
MLRKSRRISQIFFISLFFIIVFGLNTYPRAYVYPVEWFLQLNPLTAVLTSIASRDIMFGSVIIGAIIIALTIIFGRIFCGFVCPLGAVIDFSDRFLFKRRPPKMRRPSVFLQKFKYIFLIAVLILAGFGVLFSFLIDPISLFTRTVVIILYPLLMILRLDSIELIAPVIQKLGAEDVLLLSFKTPLFYGSVAVLIIFALILAGGYWERRFWCQYVCPSGAFFGLLSRFALFRRSVRRISCNGCNGGNTCAKVCPVSAIDHTDVFATSTSECVVCGVCTDIKDSCSEFSLTSQGKTVITGTNLGRRQLVAGAASGALLIPVYRGNAEKMHDDFGRIIRPPGALPEKEFLARCTGCGNCVKACKTNAIQLCQFKDGFSRVYSPKLVPKIGECEEKCHICGHVCPTGAIRPLSYEVKRFAKIGTAVINKDKCLPWEQNKECLVCDEVCPYNAITTKLLETPYGKFKVPVVNEDLCLGCGICEKHCPIFDESAICVFKFSENRISKGPYVSASEKKKILKTRKKSDKALGAVFDKPGEVRPDTTDSLPKKEAQETQELPEGFDF